MLDSGANPLTRNKSGSTPFQLAVQNTGRGGSGDAQAVAQQKSINSLLNINEKISISQICKEHNISRKHLNHLFKEYTGVSPKMLSSLHRFQRILKKISLEKPEKLTDFAYELEYFDQAHFNNDFKRFSRLNPSEYLKLVEENPTLKMVPHFLPAD